MVDVFLFYIQLSDEFFSKIGSRRCTFFAMILSSASSYSEISYFGRLL